MLDKNIKLILSKLSKAELQHVLIREIRKNRQALLRVNAILIGAKCQL